MCGIAGIFAHGAAAPAVDRAELKRSTDHMVARGPEGGGFFVSDDGRVGLGHRRLSFIELGDLGSQPMHSADGTITITFNGEIYNHQVLRAELEAKGRVFRSGSDTEVLLQLYAVKGEAMVHDLRGMFSFAIWDARKQGLFLARDPYGIKPLYYADQGGVFRFASQVKALLAGGAVSTEADPSGWAGFYLFGSVPEPFTSHRAIRSLPAGSTLWIDARGSRIDEYFNLARTYVEAETVDADFSPDAVQARVREALFDSVRHHMVADVPIGIFLSAGVDSGALLGLMRDTGQQNIEAVTLSYEEFRGTHEDEAPLAAHLAQYYGSNHTVRIVREQEFHEDLPRILEAMDQPTIDGLNSWFVSKAARELGLKGAISGLGGDELFGGYPSFRDMPRWTRAWAPWAHAPGLGRLLRRVADAFGASSLVHPKAMGMAEYAGTWPGAYMLRRGLFMPWELERVMGPEQAVEGLRGLQPVRHIAGYLKPQPRGAFAKVSVLESALYMRNQLLRDTDWASMAHSLEVRTPLVDATLLRAIAPIAPALAHQGIGKRLMANAPGKPLLNEMVNRPKTGFLTPVDGWLQRDARLRAWRDVPAVAGAHTPWARRWAIQVAG